jgi:hypothetical protein
MYLQIIVAFSYMYNVAWVYPPPPNTHTEIPDVGGDTSKALSQILDTAYNLEFNERTSTSAVRLLVERIKQAFGVSIMK